MTTRHDPALTGRLYAKPNPRDLVRDMRAIGDGLYSACAELTRNPCTAQADILLAQLQAAGHAVSRLRAAWISEAGQ